METKLKRIVTEQDLRNIPITYEGTHLYTPVRHGEAIDSLKEYLDKANFKITTESYLAASNGQRVIGKYGIRYNDEFDYMIGFANSHDGSISFKIADGSLVRACANGCLWGENVYKRKHMGTSSKDIFAQIESTVQRLEITMKQNEINSQQMKNIEIDKSTISKLIGEAYLYEELIRANQLSIIKKEIENPSFNYNSPNSLWELFNHCTFAAREETPVNWVNQHIELSEYFVNAAGILEKNPKAFSSERKVSEQLMEMIEMV